MLSLLPSCSAPLIQVGAGSGPLVQVGSNQPPATVINNVVSSACAWARPFYQDPKAAPIDKRLTRAELQQLADYNDNVKRNCPEKPKP